MAEPQPEDNPPQPPAAEQKQEAAALSNLSTNNLDEDTSSSKASSKADQAALGSALSSLSVTDNTGTTSRKPKVEVKKIKVNEEDLKFLIEHLEVSKKKANEMLQASGGDRMSAVKTYVIPAMKV